MSGEDAPRAAATPGRPDPLRVSLTLPGSGSLGAFQAGAVSALSVALHAIRGSGRRVHVDAVGGTSGAGFVGLLFTHCLLTGKDVDTMLRRAWIEELDLGLLRGGEGGAPLGFEHLREGILDLLADTDRHPPDVHPRFDGPITLQIGLTSLPGYTTGTRVGRGESTTLTFADWAEFPMREGDDPGADVDGGGSGLLDTVLASAAHPAAFAPRVLDREHRRDVYTAKGITNFPDDGLVWFTDGGAVESRPVGRVIAAARRRSGSPGKRLHLVVDPRSSGPSGNGEWGDTDGEKSWIDGLRRTVAILPTQALHDDLRRVARVNDRLDAFGHVRQSLERVIADPAERERVGRDIAQLAGIAGKEHVDLEMISPLLLADGDDGVSDLLAGDFAATFGGFLDERIRCSDYRLGQRCVAAWLPDGLRRQGCDPSLVDEVTASLPDPGDSRPDLDGDGVSSLSAGGRWKLALATATAAASLVRAAMPAPAVLGRLSGRVRGRRDRAQR